MKRAIGAWLVWRALTVAALLVAVIGAVALLSGCQVGYQIRAPLLVTQRGPEVNYNQERSGVTSRSTAAEQQVADTTAPQTQYSNEIAADMPTAMESTKQVGLKQGQAATTTKTLGDTSPATTSSEGQAPAGQVGSDTTAVGQTADAGTSQTAPAGTTSAPASATAGSPTTTPGPAAAGEK